MVWPTHTPVSGHIEHIFLNRFSRLFYLAVRQFKIIALFCVQNFVECAKMKHDLKEKKVRYPFSFTSTNWTELACRKSVVHNVGSTNPDTHTHVQTDGNDSITSAADAGGKNLHLRESTDISLMNATYSWFPSIVFLTYSAPGPCLPTFTLRNPVRSKFLLASFDHGMQLTWLTLFPFLDPQFHSQPNSSWLRGGVSAVCITWSSRQDQCKLL